MDGLTDEMALAITEMTSFSEEQVREYLDLSLARTLNKNFDDPVERFFRGLRDKLGFEGRFLRPARVYYGKEEMVPEVLARVIAVGFSRLMKDEVVVDGNHPLSGIDLSFDVEVVMVRDATDEELDHGHVHGLDGHAGH